MSATYLPVYTLSELTNPTTSDMLVVQSGASGGDVALLTINNFMSTFIQSIKDDIAIDQEVIDLYEDMGWTE